MSGPASFSLAARARVAAFRVAPLARADVVAVALLCVAPLIRLALMTGPVGSDDINYFHFAQRVLAFEHFSELSHQGGRLMFLVLAGIPATLFDSIVAGAVANIVFMSLRDVLVTLFVRREFGPTAGASAAGFLSMNALSATYAGLFMPDPVLSLAMFVTALPVLSATRAATRPARIGLVLVAGAAAAIAYSIKDTGILVAAPTGIWLLCQRRLPIAERIQLGVLYGFGFLALFALEAGIYHTLTGDALYRFHAIDEVHNAGMGGGRSLYQFLQTGFWGFLSALAPYSASLPVLATLAVAVLALVPALFRSATLVLFAATGAFVCVYLIFGTSSFTALVPMYFQDRYFEPIVPFVAVLAGAAMARLARGRDSRSAPAWLAAGVAAISFPGIASNAGDITFSTFGKNAAIALHSLRETHPETPIWVSHKFRLIIEAFVPRQTFDALRIIPPDGPLPQGYYLVHPAAGPPARAAGAQPVESLPVFLSIDLDQRKIPLLPPLPTAWMGHVIVRVNP